MARLCLICGGSTASDHSYYCGRPYRILGLKFHIFPPYKKDRKAETGVVAEAVTDKVDLAVEAVAAGTARARSRRGHLAEYMAAWKAGVRPLPEHPEHYRRRMRKLVAAGGCQPGCQTKS
jgi:hypothetical protein